MTKVLIATFSQHGSTRKIAEQIGKGLTSSEFEVTHTPITRDGVPDISDYDIIGIGSPSYFFSPPFIVQDFIRQLKGLENKYSFVFITYGTIQGNAGNQILSKLQEKGTLNLGYYKSRGADYWMGYIRRGYLFSPDSPNVLELSTAENFGKIMAARYTDNILVPAKFDPPVPWMYRIEKMLVARPLAKIYSKMFTADKNCNNCGICIKNCPVGNITQTNGKIDWHSDCILCMNCELSCPKDAIHSAFDMKIFAPFMNYNIKHAMNRNTPYLKVNHKNGRTVPA